MNIQEAFNKLVSNVSRLTGKNFAENMSEVEIIAQVEGIPSFAEQSTAFETKLSDLNTQFGELKTQFDGFKIPETISVEQMNTAIAEAVKLNSEQLNKGFATEISKLKELAESSRKPTGEVLAPTIESIAPAPEVVQKEMQIGGKKLRF